MTELIQFLQRIYDTEQNFSVQSFFDKGILVRLGDSVNGYTNEKICADFKEVIEWLCEKTGVEC